MVVVYYEEMSAGLKETLNLCNPRSAVVGAKEVGKPGVSDVYAFIRQWNLLGIRFKQADVLVRAIGKACMKLPEHIGIRLDSVYMRRLLSKSRSVKTRTCTHIQHDSS